MSGTTFSETGDIVTYTVPTTGLYDITAIGASGGDGSGPHSDGGLGADVSGDVQLTAGEVLQIAVGAAGSLGGDFMGGAGGGGGSYVVGPGGTPLVIAGGGGGGTSAFEPEAQGGNGGPIETSGGGGGDGGQVYGGGGGGGLQGDGQFGQSYTNNGVTHEGGPPGLSFTDGATAGAFISAEGTGSNGGFGGGGAGTNADEGGGGGGGGYTGGHGGVAGMGGGGGTSFDSGTNQQYSLAITAGDGVVTITPVTVANPLTVTIPEGQTENLYQIVSQGVQDTSPNAKITITSLGLTDTVGAAYLDSAHALLTYTADGYQPNTTQPQDSFTYTAEDQYGHAMTGTVDVAVSGGSTGTTLVGTSGNDQLVARASGESLIGGNGNDNLTGNGAGQTLFGGNGNDRLTANGSGSKLYGGTGTNRIRLNGDHETVVLQQGGTDRITGFSGGKGDVLDLTQVLAEAGRTGVSADEFQVVSHGNNATLFYVGGVSRGGVLAQLIGVGPDVTLQTLLDAGSLKIT